MSYQQQPYQQPPQGYPLCNPTQCRRHHPKNLQSKNVAV
ncbi:hypothetical protein EYZ11_010346 [Aspergillus tanneri]|uniref:Uncharacterized protein n=1 Tax=Aspergillus tanneri TaxID=1220188 RepID=A0A4S3J7P5_9EURO|nr:hypothetical protein EYZ11_010346 [Aspergillus tanneri]